MIEVDLKEVARDLKRKYGYECEIVTGGLMNGIALKEIIYEYMDYKLIEKEAIEVNDYIEEKWECFSEFDILDYGMEIVFNIY